MKQCRYLALKSYSLMVQDQTTHLIKCVCHFVLCWNQVPGHDTILEIHTLFSTEHTITQKYWQNIQKTQLLSHHCNIVGVFLVSFPCKNLATVGYNYWELSDCHVTKVLSASDWRAKYSSFSQRETTKYNKDGGKMQSKITLTTEWPSR